MGRKQIRDQGAQFYISLRLAKVVRLDSLRQYLEEKMEWDNSVLEGMSKLAPSTLILRKYADLPFQTFSTTFFAREQAIA